MSLKNNNLSQYTLRSGKKRAVRSLFHQWRKNSPKLEFLNRDFQKATTESSMFLKWRKQAMSEGGKNTVTLL